MLGVEVRAWIVGLDDSGAVALIRSLLLAEANRLRVDLGLVRITRNVNARDRGIDGRTDLPPNVESMHPRGPLSARRPRRLCRHELRGHTILAPGPALPLGPRRR